MNDDNFYQQFAAAAALASLPSTAALGAFPLNTSSSNLKQRIPHYQLQQNNNNFEECTIASSKLILCGFTAYIEQIDEHETRIDLVRIPKLLDDSLEV